MKASVQLWTAQECQRVHDATIDVLERVGVSVKHEPALDTFRSLGAKVEGTQVRLDESQVQK